MFPDKTRDFQKGLDPDERRRAREDDRLRLRKQDRQQHLEKKRAGMKREQMQPPANNQSQMSSENSHRISQIDQLAQQMLMRLPDLAKHCYSEDPTEQFDATQKIRQILSIERNPPIQQVIDTGVVGQLVHFLRNFSNEELQFEAAWALTNIASGSPEHTSVVIRAGAIPSFVELLGSKSIEVVEQAVWALGNIAGDSPECRNLVLDTNALQKLLPLCSANNIQTPQQLGLLRNATWTLSNFCRGKPQPDWKYVKEAIPVLQQLLFSTDEEVLQDACWAFSYLSDVDSETDDVRIQTIITGGALKLLIELLGHKSNHVKHPALRTIGNIVTGDDMQTQHVTNMGALAKLGPLLESDKKGIKKEACWTISNITAGNAEQIEAVVNANLIQPLIALLNEDEFDVRKEAAWAISNATSNGSPLQIKFLVNQGCIPPLCNLFDCDNPKIVKVALEGIENILRVGENERSSNNGVNKFADYVEECNGYEKLEALQSKDNMPDDVVDKAVEISRAYFKEDMDMNPVDNGDFMFNPKPTSDDNDNNESGATDSSHNKPFVF